MSATIDYDRHVENLIDELSKTGHVTHSKHKKKSVTFHHNGGVKVSHKGILGIWRTRPASAHFDVDFSGRVAQYVKEDEYAWAVGNTEGNEETISIELTNSTDGPEWEVSEDTWKAGARLAGWLFVHVIKDNPTKHNVFPHRHWSSTDCPGPFVMKHFDDILKEVQAWYHHFNGTSDFKSNNKLHEPVKEDSVSDRIKEIQSAVNVGMDGVWGPATDEAVLRFRKKHLKNK